MSLHTVGSDATYILPASYDSVPQAFMSNKSAKPIPCSLQTVNIPALTADATASGTSIIQIPCGSSAGIMLNPYIRFDVLLTGGGAATEYKFKGATASATALINRLSTYINSVQVDNIQNADQVYDLLFAHSTSNDWFEHDAQILLWSQAGTAAGAVEKRTVVMPLIGALGTQQGVPLFALNGTLQVQLDYNSLNRAIYQIEGGAAITGFGISNVQLVYDKISVEQMFVDKVKSDMAQGRKYVLGYTNFQSTTLIPGASAFFNYGLNVSSLRAVVAQQLLTSSLSTLYNATPANAAGFSILNGLTQFQVSLDGRLINSNTLNATTSPALTFAELNKCFSRLFDASITDISTNATYLTQSFAVGVSAQRCNEALAFAGSPVSVVGVNVNAAANATHTMFLSFISDYQLLIDASGAVEIVR
jgi:hypothetical protein